MAVCECARVRSARGGERRTAIVYSERLIRHLDLRSPLEVARVLLSCGRGAVGIARLAEIINSLIQRRDCVR